MEFGKLHVFNGQRSVVGKENEFYKWVEENNINKNTKVYSD